MDGLSPALSVQKGMTLSRAHDAAGGFDSLREAYEEVGVDGYYADHGAAYRNPHEPILIEALCLAFSKLEEAGLIDASTRPLRVLDYACGSGEGHLAILNWVDGRSERLAASVTAADPYTYMSYEKRMGYPCQRWSFEDISGGVLEEHPPFDVRGHADKAGDDEEEQGAAVGTAVAAAEDEEIEAALAEITAEIEVLNLGALRAALAEGGLDTTGKKAQLAERLREARVKAVLETAQQGLHGAAS
ncbi:hypothetical protein Ctob_004650 [Chrysochromulina tobinii]|uniref:SAP domain-containing protein n=1 Tax=Chrysochromulina tobinii TaxID=1460289 RepID=A0A0M0JP21_9EUKA|nr:hypothetical protein Ctob_004650 [Chrysochromulina tobinii]|eukprot:KOO28344.1 hypothetical protein Ctob_004650 [Chrysochromulina sp. CCMP291]